MWGAHVLSGSQQESKNICKLFWKNERKEIKSASTNIMSSLKYGIVHYIIFAECIHRVLGEDITLEISNINKNLIFMSGLVIKFIPYTQFCPKMVLPCNIFSKNWIYSLKTSKFDGNYQLNKMIFGSAIFGQKWI